MGEALETNLVPFLVLAIFVVGLAFFANIILARTKGYKLAADVAEEVSSYLGYELAREGKTFFVVQSGNGRVRIEISPYFFNVDHAVTSEYDFVIEFNWPQTIVWPEDDASADKLLKDRALDGLFEEILGPREPDEANTIKITATLIIDLNPESDESSPEGEPEIECEKYLGYTRWLNRNDLNAQMVLNSLKAVENISRRIERFKA